jgi:hypothetical protein
MFQIDCRWVSRRDPRRGDPGHDKQRKQGCSEGRERLTSRTAHGCLDPGYYAHCGILTVAFSLLQRLTSAQPEYSDSRR